MSDEMGAMWDAGRRGVQIPLSTVVVESPNPTLPAMPGLTGVFNLGENISCHAWNADRTRMFINCCITKRMLLDFGWSHCLSNLFSET